jgi:hypothetical protein
MVLDKGYIGAMYFLKVLMLLFNTTHAYIHSTALKKKKNFQTLHTKQKTIFFREKVLFCTKLNKTSLIFTKNKIMVG